MAIKTNKSKHYIRVKTAFTGVVVLCLITDTTNLPYNQKHYACCLIW